MLIEQIDKDLIEAMKGKKETETLVLRMLKSAIKNSEIQKKKNLEDTDIISVIQSQIKSRKDSITMYEKAERTELASKEKSEIEVLQKYLPEQMSEDEIREIVKKEIATTGAQGISEMGKVMGVVMSQLGGKADGSLISKIVKEELTNEDKNNN